MKEDMRVTCVSPLPGLVPEMTAFWGVSVGMLLRKAVMRLLGLFAVLQQT